MVADRKHLSGLDKLLQGLVVKGLQRRIEPQRHNARWHDAYAREQIAASRPPDSRSGSSLIGRDGIGKRGNCYGKISVPMTGRTVALVSIGCVGQLTDLPIVSHSLLAISKILP